MTENRGDNRHVDAFLQERGRQAVPEIVEPGRLEETCFRHEPFHRVGKGIGIKRRAVAAFADKIEVCPPRAEDKSTLRLICPP